MSAAAAPLSVSLAQREVLERVSRSPSVAHREVLRARVLLAAADGVGNKTIAARYSVTAVTVRAWRAAFEAHGLTRWGQIAKGRGRKPLVSDSKVAEIVELRGIRRGKQLVTTRPDSSAPRAEDHVRRDFTADRPNQLWVVDFTYVPT